MDHAPYCVNNAAARGEAAATYEKTVHELSLTSVLHSPVIHFARFEQGFA